VTSTNPKYSVCITSYNKGERVRSCLESVLSQIDGRYELVLTDNLSDDGSEKILREYAENGKLRLFQQKCSRGVGRQIAFENAKGEYIVSGIDTDDEVIPNRLSPLLQFYHEKCEGNLLRLQWSGIVIAPGELVRTIGGWRNLQWAENWDICERAARIGKYSWTIFRVKDAVDPSRHSGMGAHEWSGSAIRRNRMRYRKYLDELRLRERHGPFEGEEEFGVGRWIDYLLARISLLYFGHLNPAGTNFNDGSPEHFVDSSLWWHRVGQDESQENLMYSMLLKKTPDWSTTS